MIPPSRPVSPSAGASGADVLSAATEVDGSSPASVVGASMEGALQAPANSNMGMMNFTRRMGPLGRVEGECGMPI